MTNIDEHFNSLPENNQKPERVPGNILSSIVSVRFKNYVPSSVFVVLDTDRDLFEKWVSIYMVVYWYMTECIYGSLSYGSVSDCKHYFVVIKAHFSYIVYNWHHLYRNIKSPSG